MHAPVASQALACGPIPPPPPPATPPTAHTPTHALSPPPGAKTGKKEDFGELWGMFNLLQLNAQKVLTIDLLAAQRSRTRWAPCCAQL